MFLFFRGKNYKFIAKTPSLTDESQLITYIQDIIPSNISLHVLHSIQWDEKKKLHKRTE
jgi:hypothetical protein